MNMRLVVFSGMVMMIVGIIAGLGASKYSEKQYQCCNIGPALDLGYSQSRAPRIYALAGAAMGFIFGSTLELVRQSTPQEAKKR
ncbi:MULTISPECIES: hypothetical protein [Planktothrix]|uniref:hypothetical protein n=1 Tax=Planktothrix TaxID=54304 RepID=UPI00041AD7BB|nr:MULTISPECIES: hypothetical protein [Planktothrix]CAD0220401.1 conserved hypothetical protein [Planktothrix agardhii]